MRTDQQLFLDAITAAQKAGAAIMRIYEGDFSVTVKEDNSPVTVADLQAQKVILPVLQQSGIPVVSEESELPSYEDRCKWQRFWMVDPLDGTKEFIHRNGEFTVNIALMTDGIPEMGVVYCPATDELFAGWKGKGIWQIASASRFNFLSLDTLSGCEVLLPAISKKTYTVAVSRSHSDHATESYLHQLRKEKGEIQVLQAGSSMKFCLVAAGKADEYPRFGPTREWDTAAGHAVLLAAGKDIFDLETGNRLSYNKEDLRHSGFIAH